MEEEGHHFRVIDVHLSDRTPLDFSQPLHNPRCSELRHDDDEDDEEHQMGVVDESVQQEMKALGLPTCFSSRSARRRRKGHQVAACASVNESLLQFCLQESPSHVQVDGDDCSRACDSEANRFAVEGFMACSRDRQEGKSIDRVCASIGDDHVGTFPGASDGCGIVTHEDRVPRDATSVYKLRTMPNSAGWHAYERARIPNGGVPNSVKEATCLSMSIGPNGEKEATFSNVSTESFLELNGRTEISTNKDNACADESIMASTRIHQESGHLLELSSVKGATVLNSREPLAKEKTKISSGKEAVTLGASSNGDMKEEFIYRLTDSNDGSIVEAFAISDSQATAQVGQTITLIGSDQKVVNSVSMPSWDVRENVETKVAAREIAMEDSQILTCEVSTWSACWDEYYGRYYFCNAVTLESTWEPPKGFESYACIYAVEDNNGDGLLSVIPISEELLAKESNEERASSVDDTSGALSSEVEVLPSKIEALLSFSAVLESSSREDHLESSQSNLADEIDCDLLLEETMNDDLEGMVVGHESSFCQTTSYSSTGKSSVIHTDVATCKVSEPTRPDKLAATRLARLENRGMDVAAAMGNHNPTVVKYWAQRFRLFSKYDLGIKLDKEGWFSVTPEVLAKHQAARCRRGGGGVMVDAFAGVGGNAIQFALAGHYVVAIDNDPKRIEYARHNALVYGVADRIDFVLGDFFVVSSSMQADAVFLSPPWGGPDYLGVKVYDMQTMLQPKDGIFLFKAAQAVAPNIILYLPRNIDMDQLAELSKIASPPCSCEVERNFLNGKLKAVTAYYGKFATLGQICTSSTGEIL